ncbi:MAG: T9SS type A sorting domain-containing protein [Bacteroidota bacterium]
MHRFNLIKYISILLFVGSSLFAQEQLMPLSHNVNLNKVIPFNSINKTTSVTPLDLPFFDDFSYAYKSPYPSAANWVDSNVYVNTGFGIAPITLGVATFDGLNKKGYPYKIGNPVNYSESSDTLLSRPINLEATSTHIYSPADTIYMSFYYQAAGNGEAPESNDSLCLDFYKARQKVWKKVWGVKGYNPSSSDTAFYRVRVPIADTSYCDSLFQFRFRNKGTASGSLDHWHIDYVQIKMSYYYNDTVPDDIAFVYKPSSFLKNYSVMPYRQYNSSEMAPKFRNYIRSNFNVPKASDYNYSVSTKTGTIATDNYGTFDNPGILPFLNNGYYSGNAAMPVFTLQPFPVSFSDSAYFSIQHVLSTSVAGDTKKFNDTLTHIQRFTNYYAYDDGTAEQGYYLNTYGAKTAVRFSLNVPDTLHSVRIYFDPIVNGSAIVLSGFRIIIWDNSGNGPGNIIYKDSTSYPAYISGCHNLMPSYKLTSCLPLNSGTYYIGIQQTTNQPLNIGFDKNTNHKDALYYNISGSWVQSAVPGSLMINPVMGCALPTELVDCNTPTVSVMELAKHSEIKVYPNPAQNFITISETGNQIENSTMEMLNSLGQLILTKTINSNEQIDISTLPDGLYFIHLKSRDINFSSQKLLISR